MTFVAEDPLQLVGSHSDLKMWTWVAMDLWCALRTPVGFRKGRELMLDIGEMGGEGRRHKGFRLKSG